MEAADLGPVDVVFQQVFQQLVLGGSGGKDDVCLAAAGDNLVDALRCVLSRSRAHLFTGVVNINRKIFYFFLNHDYSPLTLVIVFLFLNDPCGYNFMPRTEPFRRMRKRLPVSLQIEQGLLQFLDSAAFSRRILFQHFAAMPHAAHQSS